MHLFGIKFAQFENVADFNPAFNGQLRTAFGTSIAIFDRSNINNFCQRNITCNIEILFMISFFVSTTYHIIAVGDRIIHENTAF